LFLAIGVVLTSHALLTPLLMVMMMVTNDFLSISLTTDRATPARSPTKWRARNATFAAALLALCKLGFSTAIVSFGKFQLGLGVAQLQTLAFVTLVFGNQALLYVVRERRRMWSSPPSRWVVAASAVDIAIVSSFALTGTMMDALPWRLMLGILAAAAGFALILDQVKLPLLRRFDAG
jgi:H+-transporting ATPase